MKKIIAINAGPRKNWNTDKLVTAAANGAMEAGAEVKYYDLYKVADFKGCRSCFGCKMERSYGKCVARDGLTEILDEIRTSDGLIIGSPNYLGNVTGEFRCLYERLVFQNLTYNKEEPQAHKAETPVLMIMTSNCGEDFYDKVGYDTLLNGYKQTLSAFVGPAEILTCGDTLQVNDYSKYKWTMFDPEAKKAHHDESFASYEEKAKQMGAALV